MPWVLLLSVTIVAAFGPRSAAASEIFGDVPVHPVVATAARELGLDPAANRARFVDELLRVIYAAHERGHSILDVIRRETKAARAAGAESIAVPLPLSAAVWSSAVFGRKVSQDQLLAAIVLDRRAALLCHGLAGLDDETLLFLERHPRVLQSLYARGAAVFATAGPAVRVRANRVVVPGGDAAVPLWEAVVGVSPSDPERFVAMLFAQRDGRLAYLYRTVEQLDDRHKRFALGLWMNDGSARAARFATLAAAASQSLGDWRIERTPFLKPQNDLSMLLARVEVEPTGAPARPSSKSFWAEVLEVSGGSSGHEGLVDASWLADALLGNNVIVRADRFDQLSFGQRLFATVGDESLPDVLTAVKGFPDQRMLMLTLERMGIRSPRVYAAAVRLAGRFAGQRAGHAFITLAQLQGALALVANLTAVGSLTTQSAETLVMSLTELAPEGEGRYRGSLAAWLDRELMPLLPAGATSEARVIAGLAGPRSAEPPRVEWEGQTYLVDLAYAERRRLETVRERQGSYTLDVALGLGRLAERLQKRGIAVSAIADAHDELTALAESHARELERSEPDVMAPGVPPLPLADKVVAHAVNELERLAATGQLRGVEALGAELADLTDAVLGETLLTLAYAQAIGDPEGTALLARNVALRHDFGLGKEGGNRPRPWALPRQSFQPGVPWHVSGSALGLDIALASLSLRRLDPDHIGQAPRLSAMDREAFAASMKMMASRQLADAGRDAVAKGIARGREQAAVLARDGGALDGIADAVGLDGWRRRALRWTIDHEPERAPSMLSLSELLTLGGGADQEAVHPWGMSVLEVYGCPCTRLVPSRAWGLLWGRPQGGFTAAIVPDLNLRIALTLAELNLPAILAGPMLGTALHDFADQADPIDANDWWALARTAAEIPRQRFEDYMGAVAAVGGPLVVADPDAGSERQ
jgi:hypothetical protein